MAARANPRLPTEAPHVPTVTDLSRGDACPDCRTPNPWRIEYGMPSGPPPPGVITAAASSNPVPRRGAAARAISRGGCPR